MKFCAVLGKYPKDVPGGAEYQSYQICKELSNRGYETHYVAHRSETESFEVDEGINLHRLNRNTSSNLRSKKHYLDDIDADVYYFRNKKDITLAALCSRYLTARVLYNIAHDYQCDSLLSLPKKRSLDVNGVISGVRLTYQKLLYGFPDEVLAQTQGQKNRLRTNRGIDAHYVGNGHPVPEPPFDKQSPPVVLWLASLKRWKQPEQFIDLAEQCSELECQFWIVGRPANKELFSEVSDRIETLDNIEYKGGCTVEESNEYISKASVFVNTSKVGMEGFPNTFVQAWLRETPVISLHKDVDRILADNVGGVLAGSKNELSRFTQKMIKDEGYRRTLAERSRTKAEESYSINNVCDRLLDLVKNDKR